MLVIVGLVLASFILIVLFGAPYVPTHRSAVDDVIKLFGKPTGRLVELGAGDGRIAFAAATAGWQVTAFELNPLLASLIWWRKRKYGDQIQVKVANYKFFNWLEDCQAIYMFGTGRDANYLVELLKQHKQPIRVVTYGFELPGLKAANKANGAILYDLPGIAKTG